jgi:hypothetical protein
VSLGCAEVSEATKRTSALSLGRLFRARPRLSLVFLSMTSDGLGECAQRAPLQAVMAVNPPHEWPECSCISST